VVGVLAVIAVAALVRPKTESALGIGDRAPAQVIQNLTDIPTSVWSKLGTRGAVAGQVIKGSSNASFLYVGALGCPFCAAERWPMTVALSRFGHFSGIDLMRSNGQDTYPNTPTFDFLHAHYTSQYLTVHLMEILGRNFSDTRGFYPELMTLTPAEARAFQKYDGPPYVPENYAESFPFLLVGNRYVWIGSTIDPGLLDQKSWLTISRDVHDDRGTIGHSILVNANALTAAICAVDGRRPLSVCRLVGSKVPATVPS